MIPQLVTVGWRRDGGRRWRLFVPVVPAVLLLSPLLLLALVAAAVTARFYGIAPVAALRAAARVLCALPGVRFEYEQGRTAVLVSVR